MKPDGRWNVIKYGTIIDDYETKIHGTYFIRQKYIYMKINTILKHGITVMLYTFKN